jgi:transcriptional regulator with XRE-family HTH domain
MDALPHGHVWRLEVDGEYIHALRIARGWTVKKMAEVTGIPYGTLYTIIYSRTTNLRMIARLASVLGVPPTELIVYYPIPHEYVDWPLPGYTPPVQEVERKPKPLRLHREWTLEEEEILRTLAERYAPRQHKWLLIAHHMKRTPASCRIRWHTIRRRDAQTESDMDE